MTATTQQRRAARIRAEWAEEREHWRLAGSEFVRQLCRAKMRLIAEWRMAPRGNLNGEAAR